MGMGSSLWIFFFGGRGYVASVQRDKSSVGYVFPLGCLCWLAEHVYDYVCFTAYVMGFKGEYCYSWYSPGASHLLHYLNRDAISN